MHKIRSLEGKRWFIWALVVIVVSLVGLAAYITYVAENDSASLSDGVITTRTQKTYVNSDYGLRFSYSVADFLRESDSQQTHTISIYDKDQKPIMEITIDSPKTSSLEAGLKFSSNYQVHKKYLNDLVSVLVDHKPAILANFVESPSKSYSSVYVVNKGKVLSFSGSIIDSPNRVSDPIMKSVKIY